jgi:hypothetical protein
VKPSATPTSILELVRPPSDTVPEHMVADWKTQFESAEKMYKEIGRAKYKVELLFWHKHVVNTKMSVGLVTFWENASKLNGGADSKLYVCDTVDNSSRKQGCKKIIPDSSQGYGIVVCPHCSMSWNTSEIVGEVIYKQTMQGWSDLLIRWMQKLELSVDLVMKYNRDDIRVVSAVEQEKQHMGDKLGLARSGARRTTVTYTLANIIKDTSAGADLRSRVLAFLKA